MGKIGGGGGGGGLHIGLGNLRKTLIQPRSVIIPTSKNPRASDHASYTPSSLSPNQQSNKI